MASIEQAAGEAGSDGLGALLRVSLNDDGTLQPAAVQSAIGGSQTLLKPSGGDDSSAIAAGGKAVAFQLGTFVTAAGVTFSQQAALSGLGAADRDYTTVLTEITCPTDATVALTLDANGCYCDRFGVRYTGIGAPTSGAGISVKAASPYHTSVRLSDLVVNGFYDGIDVDGSGHLLRGIVVADAVRYGILLTNGNSGDNGDRRLTDIWLLAGPNNAGTTALRWQSGGGDQIKGLKVNKRPGSKFWTNAVEIVPDASVATTELTLAESVLDNYTGLGVHVDTSASGANLQQVLFDGVQVRSSGNPTQGYYIRGGGNLGRVSILGGLVEMGTNANSCIDIDQVTRLTIEGTEIGGIESATKPLITIGTNVFGWTIRPGTLFPASGHTAWPTGSAYYLLHNGSPNQQPVGGLNVIEFSFRHPTITSNSVYSNLWHVKAGSFGTGPMLVELFLCAPNVSPTTSLGSVMVVQKRMIYLTTTGAIATYGTDSATTSDIDVLWSQAGTDFTIQAKIDPASTLTSLGSALYSVIRITGGVQDVFAYA